MVIARPGKLPIILTAPHGGTYPVGFARERTKGTTVTDAGTLELTEELAKRLTALLGAPPYLVAARFSRKYIDANRPEQEAFENEALRAPYEAYHGWVREFVAEARSRYPKGAVLIDIHGQGSDGDTSHRGTSNGRTVTRLIEKHGAAALTGKDSIFGVLQSRRRTVFPANTPMGEPPEDQRYSGGFTVRSYGSHTPDGIDAIQIEIGTRLRNASGFVDDLAEAIAVFYKAYLQ